MSDVPKWGEVVPVGSFLMMLRSSRDQGSGFVPLVGAGLSAPSGVPIVSEIRGYLRRCIAMALGLDRPDWWPPTADGATREWRWLPCRDEWPTFGDPHGAAPDHVDWVWRLEEVVRESRRARLEQLNASSGTSPKIWPELDLMQEAFGAAAEWRTSLLFLSRLRQSDLHENQTRSLGPPDLDVVDTFFLNVVLKKRPTLGHRMLVRLAGPLRINTALTTNFDDLLERAFAETENIFTVFDVHLETGLPSFRDMRGRNSLVKLHGGRYGLRADYSLDRSPTDDDLRHFVSYFADRPVSAREWEDARSDGSIIPAKQLLVVGVSAKDERIRAMLHAAVKALKGFEVFWVAYGQHDAEHARELLREIFVEREPRFIIAKHKFQGLLFLQMYQELMSSIPASGTVFPSGPRLPVPPQASANDQTEEQRQFVALIRSRIWRCLGPSKGPAVTTRAIFVASAPDCFGVVSAAAAAFDEELDAERQALWLDLDEITGCGDLFEVVLHAVARKAGIVDWLPVVLKADPAAPTEMESAQLREVARITNDPNRQWVIFLNVRCGAGVNVERPYTDESGTVVPNGWVDLVQPAHADPTASGSAFLTFIRRLAGSECANVTVVVLCYDAPTGLMGMVRGSLSGIPEPLVLNKTLLKGLPTLDRVVTEALDRFREDESRRRFLHALSLCNKVRYPAMVWYWPFHTPDRTSSERIRDAKDWVDEFERAHLIRQKLGGFIWMHCEVRNKLREALSKPSSYSVSDIHHGLAEWYRRLLLSSDEPLAAFEVVYHRCKQCVELIRNSEPAVGSVVDALADAQRALELGRPAMLAWGFSKGLCRRLDQVRNDYVEEVVTALEICSLEASSIALLWQWIDRIRFTTLRLNRAIAREVGENVVAFERHVELRFEQYKARAKAAGRAMSISYGDREEKNADKRLLFAQTILHPHRFGAADDLSAREPLRDWIDSCNEMGILGNAVRAFTFSEKAFGKVYDRFGFPKHILSQSQHAYRNAPEVRSWWNGLRSECARLGSDIDSSADGLQGQVQVVAGLLETFQRHQQVCLARGVALVAMHRPLSQNDERTMDRAHAEWFERSCRLYEVADEVMRYQHANEHHERMERHPDGKQVNPPSWLRVRPRMEVQHATALAFLGDFEKAHRRLNEAEGSLGESSHREQPMERAIIELHRADILTRQALVAEPIASTLSNHKDLVPELSILGQFRRRILGNSSSQLGGAVAATGAYEKFLAPSGLQQGKVFARSLSSVADAWQTLLRAEHVLLTRRKNAWWTTWFFELRIRLIELRLVAELGEFIIHRGLGQSTEPQLPELDLQFAPYGFPTVPDRIVDGAQRIVRLDLFRYASIAESYANCLLVLVLCRELAPRGSGSGEGGFSSRLERRQREVRERLVEVNRVLSNRRSSRFELDGKYPGTKLDETVEQYVDFVLDHTKNVARLASEGLESER